MPAPASPSARQRLTVAAGLVLTGVLIFAFRVVALAVAYPALARLFPAARPAIRASAFVVVAVVSVAGLRLGVRLVERRRADEVSAAGAVRWSLGGLAVGLGMFCLVVGVLMEAGVARVGGYAGLAAAPMMFIASLGAAVSEEIVFRGALYQAVERLAGRGAALFVSAVVFGLLHAFNPGATVTSTLAIAVEAGLLLGLAFAYARSLWFPIGIHLGWNFCEGGVFGAAVSGGAARGVFPIALHGPTLVTGGAFGPEASLVAMVVSLAVSGLLAFALTRGLTRRGPGPPHLRANASGSGP
ncbi:MAG TPA: type II CAAX endopeptidase family protein [Caulobacteraceae bacterium]|nr:type II CAAX endopeptidase family protein [Caulobacteraceae bacterium]